jgi:hypothetical protein
MQIQLQKSLILHQLALRPFELMSLGCDGAFVVDDNYRVGPLGHALRYVARLFS